MRKGARRGLVTRVKAPFPYNTGDSSKKIKDLPREINSTRKILVYYSSILSSQICNHRT